jgi:hypothetical protein
MFNPCYIYAYVDDFDDVNVNFFGACIWCFGIFLYEILDVFVRGF